MTLHFIARVPSTLASTYVYITRVKHSVMEIMNAIWARMRTCLDVGAAVYRVTREYDKYL